MSKQAVVPVMERDAPAAIVMRRRPDPARRTLELVAAVRDLGGRHVPVVHAGRARGLAKSTAKDAAARAAELGLLVLEEIRAPRPVQRVLVASLVFPPG